MDRRQVGSILTQRHFLNLLQNVGYILDRIDFEKKALLFTPGNMLLKPSKTPQKWADSIPKSDVLAPKMAK